MGRAFSQKNSNSFVKEKFSLIRSTQSNFKAFTTFCLFQSFANCVWILSILWWAKPMEHAQIHWPLMVLQGEIPLHYVVILWANMSMWKLVAAQRQQHWLLIQPWLPAGESKCLISNATVEAELQRVVCNITLGYLANSSLSPTMTWTPICFLIQTTVFASEEKMDSVPLIILFKTGKQRKMHLGPHNVGL